MAKIFVIVKDGEAHIREDTVPKEMCVEVIDLDLIRAGQSFPSPEAFAYCQENQIFSNRRTKDKGVEIDRRKEDEPAA